MRTLPEGWTAQLGSLGTLAAVVTAFYTEPAQTFSLGLTLASLPTGVPEGRNTDESEREKPTPPAPVPGKLWA